MSLITFILLLISVGSITAFGILWSFYSALKPAEQVEVSLKKEPYPKCENWNSVDQKTVAGFLKSEQGIKFVEACRHKLFSDHLDACQTAGNAEAHNASMKGANNLLSFILYLATEDSISSQSDLVKADNAEPDYAQSGFLNSGR